MKTIFHPLLVLLAKLTDPVVARQLKHQARELQFAKAENEQLRGRLPERVILTPHERRRLIRLGKPQVGRRCSSSALACRYRSKTGSVPCCRPVSRSDSDLRQDSTEARRRFSETSFLYRATHPEQNGRG